MTQPPQSGQTAPRTTDFGSVTPPRHGSSAEDTSSNPRVQDGPWGSSAAASPTVQTPRGGNQVAPNPAANPAFGAPVAPDAPTGSMPLVTGTAFAPDTSSRSSGAGAAALNGSAPAGGQNRARTTRARGPRRARLQLRNINPWTVLKFSCVLSIALFFVWLIVVGVLFGVLDAAGIIDKINNTVTQLNGPGSKAPVTAGIVFGGAAIIGVVNIVLFVALSTVGSVVYNLCADLVGGVEITLSER